MPLQIIRQDITRIRCDAVVNPTNELLDPGGGTDAAIHRAAGPGLLAACSSLGGCEIGEAKLTPAFDLPCKYVIHTVGPFWQGGEHGEEEQLKRSYLSSLQLAAEVGCESVALPLISSGTHGFPKEQVLRLATRFASEFLLDHDMLVYIVVYDKDSYRISKELFLGVSSFIDDNYVSESDRCEFAQLGPERRRRRESSVRKITRADGCISISDSLDSMLEDMDADFAEMLFGLIDRSGMSDVECYKRANVDKKVFSKIKCNKGYRPSKNTAIAFAIALRLDIGDTEALLRTAGYALSRSNKFDVIITYFILNKRYDIFEINETLFDFDQPLLGC